MPRPSHVSIPGTRREIPRIGLGAMPLSLDGRPDRGAAKAVLRRAVESGVGIIDTADSYALDDADRGHNERLVAETFREMGLDPAAGLVDADTPVIATKGGRTRPGGRWGIDGRPEHLRAACHASLKALGVERIPVYQLHTPDPEVPFEESVGALVRLVEEGKIAHVGLSNVTVEHVDRARALTPIVSVQNSLSVWEAGLRFPPVVRRCAEAGILFMAYAPLGGRGRARRLSEAPALAELSSRLGCSPQELALAWLLELDPVVVPIPGATTPESVISSVRAGTLVLDGPAKRLLRGAVRRMPGRTGLAARVLGKLRGLLPG